MYLQIHINYSLLTIYTNLILFFVVFNIIFIISQNISDILKYKNTSNTEIIYNEFSQIVSMTIDCTNNYRVKLINLNDSIFFLLNSDPSNLNK